ncbi:FAD-dependent monooxygenase [Variovorax sp. PvP013]|uniref:FAD-dependent monooxygenase n=1 Tax=Variovorax sp. PvP013 TaxID=3156435 RepID=UPI003D20245F
MPLRILVTGASIAGNATAWALTRAGCEVLVVERAAAFRDGGQNVDVRGVGREVMRRMDLERAALDQGTGEEGTAWVDAQGRAAAEFRTSDLERDGPTAEMEILRGDLARLLYDAARTRTAYRFGDHIAQVEDDGTAATVCFASGSTERFDAVVVAEGVGSATRERVFAGENDARWMNLTLAYFTIARAADDDRLWRWYHATDGRSVSLRPDRHGTTRAMLSIQKAPEGEQDWNVERQKRFLHERFADAGWQSKRVLAGMETAEDFYFDVLRQVRLPRWHRGRVVLTGDAAWCATPLAGIGTTLALVGAYVLAGEIARAGGIGDPVRAFAAYEAAMRPMVEQAQNVPRIGPRLMNPHSRLGIHLLHGVLHLASLPGLRDAFAKLMNRKLDEPDLSHYGIGSP